MVQKEISIKMGQKNKNISSVDATTGRAVVSSNFYNDGINHYVIPCSDDLLMNQLNNTSSYDDWLDDFKKQKSVTPDFGYGGTVTERIRRTARFQILNFLYAHRGYAYSRIQLDKIQKVLCDSEKLSTDVIQSVNKTDQNGMARFAFTWSGKQWYCIPVIAFTDEKMNIRHTNIDSDIDAATATQRRKFFAWANGQFERGHKDPRKPLNDSNLVMQPADINGSRRDRYIFDDDGLPYAHNPVFCLRNPNELIKMYPNADDRKDMIRAFLNTL